MSAPAILQAEGLRFSRGRHAVLDGVGLSLRPGEVVALLGPNGCGKTTLLRLLLGLLCPQAGSVRLDGRPLGAWGRRAIARRLAYVPQLHVPVFPFTARAVVGLGRLPQAGFGGLLGRTDTDATDAALDRLRVLPLADRPYTELSGGERQAVLIARALAQGAGMLILDEPMTGLDHGQQLRLYGLIRGLAADGLAILSTTHDPLRARDRFDRAILLRDGIIQADGPARSTLDDRAIEALYAKPG